MPREAPLRVLWIAVLWVLLGGTVHAQPEVGTIAQAHAYLEPDGAEPWSGLVALPHLWDKAYPGKSGRARYLLTLPPCRPMESSGGSIFPGWATRSKFSSAAI